MPSQFWNHTLAYKCGFIYLNVAMLLLLLKEGGATLAQLGCLATAQQEGQWYSAGPTQKALEST